MKIRVKVKPNAGEQGVERISDELFSEKGFEGLYFVKLKSSAEDGKANLELIKLLNKYFDAQERTPRRCENPKEGRDLFEAPKHFSEKCLLGAKKIKIKSGFTSRNKIVEVGN